MRGKRLLIIVTRDWMVNRSPFVENLRRRTHVLSVESRDTIMIICSLQVLISPSVTIGIFHTIPCITFTSS